MNDRELLELAALAADIEHGADRLDYGLSLTLPSGQHRSLRRWNPLENDGDALRLAVKCGIEISIVDECGLPRACAGYATDRDPRIRYVFEGHGNDIFAATRRAIAGAAAKIGQTLRLYSNAQNTAEKAEQLDGGSPCAHEFAVAPSSGIRLCTLCGLSEDVATSRAKRTALRLPEPMTSSEISDYARAMVKGDRSVDWLAMQIEAEILRRVREANK